MERRQNAEGMGETGVQGGETVEGGGGEIVEGRGGEGRNGGPSGPEAVNHVSTATFYATNGVIIQYPPTMPNCARLTSMFSSQRCEYFQRTASQQHSHRRRFAATVLLAAGKISSYEDVECTCVVGKGGITMNHFTYAECDFMQHFRLPTEVPPRTESPASLDYRALSCNVCGHPNPAVSCRYCALPACIDCSHESTVGEALLNDLGSACKKCTYSDLDPGIPEADTWKQNIMHRMVLHTTLVFSYHYV
jgi:hypothetical protein